PLLIHSLPHTPPPSRPHTPLPYTTLFRSFAVNTAEKASHMLTRQIFKKKTPAELSGIATLMKEQMWEAEDANNQQTRIAVPVSRDRKSTRLNSSHVSISYAVCCLQQKIDR